MDSATLERLEKIERRHYACEQIINSLCRRLSDEDKAEMMKEISALNQRYGQPKISEIAHGIIAS